MSDVPALLVTGHGTRDPVGVATFDALIDRIAGLLGPTGVEVAGGFIELSRPPLRDAVTRLVEHGHRKIVAVPLVLSAAGHAKGDIPAALSRERTRHPAVTWRYGRPLGPHPVLQELLDRRVTQVAADLPDPHAVLVVGRGSTDPDANAEVCKVARLLWEGRARYAFTETAFVSLTRPGVPEGLDRCRRLGARHIVVARYLLLPGVLPDRVARQAAAYADAHPDVQVRCTEVLGDCDEIAGLVAYRYAEALAGDIRMNCDTCVYRTALPGFEHKVGAPQRPHDHPDDRHDGHGDSHGHPHPPDRSRADAVAWTEAPSPARIPPPGIQRTAPPAPVRRPPARPAPAAGHDVDLGFHGDAELAPDLVDMAVNVRRDAPPPWLVERLREAVAAVDRYPDPGAATAAVADRHRRLTDEVLVTAGAAEAFTLIARAFTPRRAVVVHPQFTEPEAALRAAGHRVDRVILDGDFRFDPARVPADADLVVVGNPTNPTSVLHPAAAISALARPGRLLVVDEAFADCVPGEPDSLAGRRDLPGLIVVRSLTKTWGLAGLRAGYLLGSAAHVAALRRVRPPWAVSAPALAAVIACSTPRARAETAAWAAAVSAERDRLTHILTTIPSVTVTPGARASFLLLHVPDGARVRAGLRSAGFAVRRGDTFPGLGPDWLRVTVRDRDTDDRFAATLRAVVAQARGGARRAG